MKKNSINVSFLLLAILFFSSCTKSQKVDAVYYNGTVYSVDSVFSIHHAFAVKDGKVIALGSNDEILKYDAKDKIDLNGKYVYPGLIDAHCHFYGYGVDLKKIWLIGTTSFEQILDTLVKCKDQKFMGWVFGRGWDQNDWTVKEFPDKEKLDSLFPDVPVFLMRIDGHAALVNQVALDLAGVTADTKIEGGEVVLKNGKPTGLLIDNVVDIVKLKIPEPTSKYLSEALIAAQNNCFKVGLTTVDDAGLELKKIMLIDSLQKANELKMRIYAMAIYDETNANYYAKNGKYKSDRLNVRSFKLYADGALGSRGACLLDSYSDQVHHHGMLLKSIDSILYAANLAAKIGFQLNTHCIGDSANSILLDIYSQNLQIGNNKRWRIEHAQVLAPEDFSLFKKYNIIPSVQPTHATSDMYWAKDRLGDERIKYAYAYNKLLKEAGLLAGGSDFPVEDINPLYGFYAAVSRKDQKHFPEKGFQKENAVTRLEALKAMTIWAAYSNFEEDEKGSLEPGKFADFVVLEDDLMKAPEEKLFDIKVLYTYLNGEQVYKR